MFAPRSIGNTKQDGCTTGYLSKCKMTRTKANKREKRKCVRTQYVDLCQKQRKR